ncbi:MULTISPECIES: hypothetical protein [Methylobacterium]|uniref:hypothetical protein n=1 Tax=Methylobacterium TaxID=407 RepID=UPI0012E92FF9|nr:MULTISPECIES: hypothetical protein [Methylobacterium]MCI9882584.1 hypothetical protein [Methylobacterium goesingense]
MTPPLLPTLMMAVILGAASYLCHEPAAVAPPASVPATAVAAAPEAEAETLHIPAPLAFQTQFPLAMVAQAEPAPVVQAHRSTPRTATRLTAPRRVEAPRVAVKTSPADKPLPFVAEVEAASAVSDGDEGVLPEAALPFAPTIRAVTRASAAAGAFVGAQGAALGAGTASLGAAVSGWVERLR